eukprot:12854305-Prorocentrum_lima.AAC.1
MLLLRRTRVNKPNQKMPGHIAGVGQPRANQVCFRERTSAEGSTNINWDDAKGRINEGHRTCCGTIILARP